MMILRILVARLVRMARSISIFWDRCSGKRWIIYSEVLYQASIFLVPDSDLLSDSMHLTMNVVEI